MLAASSTRCPSAVRPGSSRRAASSSRRRSSVSIRRRIAWRSDRSGATTTPPVRPSTATSVPVPIASSSPEHDTTAGTPSARARIAAWLVGDPVSVTMPAISVGGMLAVCDGVSSWAAITDRTSGRAPAVLRPSRMLTTRSRTSSRSAALAARYSLSDAASSSRNDPNAPTTARSADASAWIASSASRNSSGSAANSAWASKISASAGPAISSTVSPSSTRPASASSAPSPVVRMRISSPWWQSSVRTDSTDFALTSFPPFTSTTSAAKDAAARAKILAGRAWRPVGFRNTTVASGTRRALRRRSDRSGVAASSQPPLRLDGPHPYLVPAEVGRSGHGRARKHARRGAPGHAFSHRPGPLPAGRQEPRQQGVPSPHRAPGNHHAVLAVHRPGIVDQDRAIRAQRDEDGPNPVGTELFGGGHDVSQRLQMTPDHLGQLGLVWLKQARPGGQPPLGGPPTGVPRPPTPPPANRRDQPGVEIVGRPGGERAAGGDPSRPAAGRHGAHQERIELRVGHAGARSVELRHCAVRLDHGDVRPDGVRDPDRRDLDTEALEERGELVALESSQRNHGPGRMAVGSQGPGDVHPLASRIEVDGAGTDDLTPVQRIHLHGSIEAGVRGDRDDHPIDPGRRSGSAIGDGRHGSMTTFNPAPLVTVSMARWISLRGSRWVIRSSTATVPLEMSSTASRLWRGADP